MSSDRPWRRSLAWLAFLGPFFFASYGFANWLAARHAHVGAVVFAWEAHIPFVPWTIIPYWSIDALYAIAILICTTRSELDRHALRLLLIQVSCVACFIAFPLRFSFDRPETHGISADLFRALASFDKPFNQAPSLHIALLVVIWVRLSAHVHRFRSLLHVWMLLIGVSVLTTYQHHFIDLPTGLAVGCLALWVVPESGPSPLQRMNWSSDAKRQRIAICYLTGALACTVAAVAGGAWLWFCWPAVALLLVALNYLAIGAGGFQKDDRGTIAVGARWLFAPYLIGAWVNSRAWTFRRAPHARVVDDVWIGRLPAAAEASGFSAVIDMSAELPCGVACEYHCIPVLDLTTPSSDELHRAAIAIERAREHGPVLVCCALGYSRSAAAVAAWLKTTGRAATTTDAMHTVAQVRNVVLTTQHVQALEEIA